jgi:hypothetical protein
LSSSSSLSDSHNHHDAETIIENALQTLTDTQKQNNTSYGAAQNIPWLDDSTLWCCYYRQGGSFFVRDELYSKCSVPLARCLGSIRNKSFVVVILWKRRIHGWIHQSIRLGLDWTGLDWTGCFSCVAPTVSNAIIWES